MTKTFKYIGTIIGAVILITGLFVTLVPQISLAQIGENPTIDLGPGSGLDPFGLDNGGGLTPPGGQPVIWETTGQTEPLSDPFGGDPNYTTYNYNTGTSCNYVDGSGLGGLLDIVLCLLGKIIPILVVIAIIVFIYGVVKYIRNADNSEQRKEGSMFMLYGIIALFVMVSIWALVGILAATIGVDVILPQLPE